MSRKVYAAQCFITFRLDFDDLEDELGMSVDEIRDLWDKGELAEEITDKLNLAQVIELSQDPFAGSLEVGSGIVI